MDLGTMVLAGSEGSDTIRLGGTGPYPGTRVEQDTGTMVSALGTMVINSDEEEEEGDGTIKSKEHVHLPLRMWDCYSHLSTRGCCRTASFPQGELDGLTVFIVIYLSICLCNQYP